MLMMWRAVAEKVPRGLKERIQRIRFLRLVCRKTDSLPETMWDDDPGFPG